MSTLETNLIQPSTGTTLTLGASGDTVDVPSGATLDVTGATVSGLTTGKVLQTVTGVTTTNTQITSTSFADTSLTANITPSATSSKVLILISQNVQMQRNAGSNREITANTKLLRGSTELGLKTVGIGVGDGMSGVMGSRNTISYAHLDSPNSSSQITYKTTGAANTTDDAATIRFQEGGTKSEIVLIEIEG
jgi:hypothetical protein